MQAILISPRTGRRWAESWAMLADTPRHLTKIDATRVSTYAAESVQLDISLREISDAH